MRALKTGFRELLENRAKLHSSHECHGEPVNCSTLDNLNNCGHYGAQFSPTFFSMERSQIHRVSVADQVAGILRQRILEGELRPGAALMEIPLASSLGVSRNTMRDAMRILSLEGLLKRNIHRGVLVSQL